MPRRTFTVMSCAALLTLPVASAASARHGADDRGGAKQEQRVGASTVASYDGSTLVLTLADGSSLSGAVTRRTEIECTRRPASQAASRSKHGSDDPAGDDRGGQRAPGVSDDPATTPTPAPASTTPAGTTPAPTTTTPTTTTPAGTTPALGRRCGTALLVSGAAVRKARVRGGVFKKVHLYR